MTTRIDLPALESRQREVLEVATRLWQACPTGWTIVGGQMVFLHALCSHLAYYRPTDDLDFGIDLRSNHHAFQNVVETIECLGFHPARNPWGSEHRWQREDLVIDLLVASNTRSLGRYRSDVARITPVESHGIEQALKRSTPTVLGFSDGQSGTVNLPSLLGALVAKAAALQNRSDRHPIRHAQDLAILASSMTGPDYDAITSSDRKYLLAALPLARKHCSPDQEPGLAALATILTQ